jgi:hypothetical protein
MLCLLLVGFTVGVAFFASLLTYEDPTNPWHRVDY